MSVSEMDRQAVFQKAWEEGGGFRFMFNTFGDIATDRDANEAAASFVRGKIAEIVKDPETARKLTPTDLYAKRPLCDSGYYATFNRDNVELVSVKETPILELTPKGHQDVRRRRARARCADLRHRLRCRGRQLHADLHSWPRRRNHPGPLEGRPDKLPRHHHRRIPEHVHDPRTERSLHEPAAEH